MGLALLTGKGCLLSVLDYLGPAAETGLVSVGRIGLFGSGRVDRQGVSTGRVRQFGSSRGDWLGCPSGVLDCLGSALLTGKGCLLSVLDYLGPAAETSFGVCRTYWTVWVWPC